MFGLSLMIIKLLNHMKIFFLRHVIILIFLFLFINSFSQNTRLWATYYGGISSDNANAITTDALGNVYLVGTTQSSTNVSFSGFQNIFGGGSDAFLVKFDAGGNRLWATYYGGTGLEQGITVVTDVNGNVYLAGVTDSPTNISFGGFQNTFAGGACDAFLVKFDAITGNRLWATYYGGIGADYGYGLATDGSGNVYLAGHIDTPGINIASGGFQNTFGGGSADAFLAKFDAVGARLWATYYGGLSDDKANSITTDATGNVYLVGTTTSQTDIASGGFQNTFAGGVDAFIVKFNTSGMRLWSSYYGSIDNEWGYSIVTDAFSNVYIAGETTGFSNIASGGFQNIFGGGATGTADAFLVKFDALGNRLWATLLWWGFG